MLRGAPPTDEVGPELQVLCPPVVAVEVGDSWRGLREGTPLRGFTGLDTAAFGGKFTSRWTWWASSLNSTGSASKSLHTARVISSHRVGCRSAKTKVPVLGHENQMDVKPKGTVTARTNVLVDTHKPTV
ncbi:hypothetical protein GCM10020367_49210 [Streptomyces sannanensis]|uniref:Uncharacterized protein n=1 Tax=Streptomyces sannanensis TaxID=285536 RepID=A0ABP6SH01_9ACTN